jgi:CBS domain-containing protein
MPTHQPAPPPRQPLERVRDVMTHEVFSLGPDLSVADAWEALAGRGFGQAPVLMRKAG